MSVLVYEHYRPMKENDQMLMSISNVNYVTQAMSGCVVNPPIWHFEGNLYKLIFNELDIKDIPQFINDFVFYNNIPQPCNISIYAIKTTSINQMPVVIRDILEHNRII